MHLRTLTVQAIGPFADRYTVDLAELGASGLFLLEGPTGAGKSTLIDAVVFALYGKVASDQASDERLRSDHAGPATESFVDLVFEVQAGTFRIRRTPQYERAKQRGAGTTTQPATVRAWRLPADTPSGATPEVLDGYGTPVASRLDEVGQLVQDAVGLDRAQFVQTIVLPQGQFASFLQAKPEDRRGLLQKIFGTAVYDRMQTRLAEMRREADRSVEAGRAALGEAVARFVGAARLTEDDAQALRVAVDAAVAAGRAVAPAAPDDVLGVVVPAVRAAVEERSGLLAEVAAHAASDAVAAVTVRDAAREALDLATGQAALLARRDRLRRQHAELAEHAAEHVAAVRRLARGRAAVGVRPLLAAAASAATALDAATKVLEAAFDATPAGVAPAGDVGDLAAADRMRDELEAVSGAARQTAARLERAVALEAGLDARRRHVRTQAVALDDLRAEVAAHDAWLAARPTARRELVQSLDEARALAARLGERQAAVTRAAETVEAVAALAATGVALAAVDERRTAAALAAREATEREAALRLARIAGLAGELAEVLVPGDPCPVCGATEHPAKARLAPDHVSSDDVEEAALARARAEARLTELVAQAAGLQGRAAELVVRTGGQDEEAARDALAQAQAACEPCSAAADDESRLAAELDGFDVATAVRSAERDEVSGRLSVDEGAQVAARDALDRDEAEVVEARAEHPTVAARHAAVLEGASAAESLCAALGDRAGAADRLATRQEELAHGRAAAGFETDDDARAALLDGDELTELERAVADHEAEVSRVAAGLAEPELAALSDDLVVDVVAVGAAERTARAEAERATGLARLAADCAQAAADAAVTVAARAGVVAEAVAVAAPVSRLASLAAAGGDNAQGLSLATFVLLRRFEDVVAAANDRLLGMSDGRFELVRSDEKEDVRGRATGLAMRVIDHRTDAPRDPRTLSGGETFYVSLCLALGMADVVTAEAGGIDLGTLFVDEGFGSLDAHVLDQVLAELGRLRAGGRVVGIVSHVEALKQAVADRIEVRPRADGSSELRVRAG